MNQKIALTREEIRNLEESGAKMPIGFTGKWKGRIFYKGRVWGGPDNRIGYGKRFVEDRDGALVTDSRYV
jgi:hypothetical protein